MKFPYLKFKGIKCPIIPIEIRGKKRWEMMLAYVDSGATYSIFSDKEAELLGIEIDKGRKIYLVVGNGAYLPAYLFRLPVKIGGIKIKATIGFSKKLGVGFNILGRKDIFNKFQVCFNDKHEMLTFEKI